MKCPTCGNAELVYVTRDLPISLNGWAGVVLAVTGDFCPACGEVLLGKQEGQRFGAQFRALRQQGQQQ